MPCYCVMGDGRTSADFSCDDDDHAMGAAVAIVSTEALFGTKWYGDSPMLCRRVGPERYVDVAPVELIDEEVDSGTPIQEPGHGEGRR